MQGFVEGLTVEMRPCGITVRSVARGPVGTVYAARSGMQMLRAETPQTVAQVALAALPRDAARCGRVACETAGLVVLESTHHGCGQPALRTPAIKLSTIGSMI